MASIIICEGSITIPESPARLPTCDTGYLVVPYDPEPPVDFHDLVALLQFDPEICALLIGICVLFFIIGHSAGHVARNLGRV